MPSTRRAVVALAVTILSLSIACGGESRREDSELSLAVDEYVDESGLLNAMLPAFEEETDYQVKLTPGDTMASLQAGRSGVADATLTNDPDAEEAFIQDGFGVNRRSVMRDAGNPTTARVYHVMQVEPASVAGVNAEGASVLIEFLISNEGQEIIRSFTSKESGTPVFIPLADGEPET
jgi:ABC-type tungstate transport system permease subunit